MSIIAEHDRLKAADGWYDDDWTRVNPATEARKPQTGVKHLKSLGFATQKMETGDGADSPFPGLVRGRSAAAAAGIPARFAGSLTTGSVGPATGSKRFGDQLIDGQRQKLGIAGVHPEIRAFFTTDSDVPRFSAPKPPQPRKTTTSAPSTSKTGTASRTRPVILSSSPNDHEEDDGDVFTDSRGNNGEDDGSGLFVSDVEMGDD